MELRKFDEVPYNPTQEKILEILRCKTQNLESDLYFRVLASFYICQAASSMRVSINTPHRGNIPVNLYALNLGESGMSKGHSMNIMERHVLGEFRKKFLEYTMPEVAEQAINDAANQMAMYNGTDVEEELVKLQKEYDSCGAFLFSYDSGTGPAYKQLRTKCQIAGIGSMNLITDEIGRNLLKNEELLATNLEAYDVGLIKAKLIKNSSENTRSKDRDDPVPSNMICFGAPAALFDGGPVEKELDALFDTGYARRFIYGYGQKTNTNQTTAEELYDLLTSGSVEGDISDLANHFGSLADSLMVGRELSIQKNVVLINIQYQIECEAKAAEYSEYDSIRKAEMQHRYFRALKIAGAYAFVENSHEVTEAHMYAAIRLVEDSGKCFEERIMTRDKSYIRLAKYICEVKREVTHADLSEDLPFYSGSKAAREDMINLATAWGFKNNRMIKKSYADGIEFFKGETLEETDLDNLIIAYSDHEAYRYNNTYVPWGKMDVFSKQTQASHWVNHHVADGHRKEDNVLAGFNMVVIDVDEGCKVSMAHELMEGITSFIYTTKRHTDAENRFRIVIPLKYKLHLGAKEFKDFMNNIFEWLPFNTDEGTNQRCKKWLTCATAQTRHIHGELLDPIQFIPKTAKNDERVAQAKDLSNLDKIETWFARKMVDGSRNNTILKYAFMLLDSGMTPTDVEDAVIAFNDKLNNALSLDELKNTVIKSLYKKATGGLNGD